MDSRHRDAAVFEMICHPEQEPDPRFEQLRVKATAEGRICVVNALVMDADKILILRRGPWKSFLPNCWDLPGGHVQSGETLEAALRREVAEEIDSQVDTIDALIAIWDWERPAQRDCKLMRQFEFMVGLTKLRHELQFNANDFTERRWIVESELPVMLENRASSDTQMFEVLRHAFRVKALRS